MSMDCFQLVAQAAPSPGAQNLAGILPIALLGGMLVFMMMTARSQKKREQKTREEMYAKLARNDRVLTIGGVIGTILSVKDDEVVLKVDETTNTKMTFTKTAIQRIMEDAVAGK